MQADERPEPGSASEPTEIEPGPATADPVADELSRLRAERDALRSRLDALEHKAHRQGRIRATAVGVLVVLTCLSLVAGVVGVWARRNFLDTDRFVERVGPLAEDPAVQDVVTARLTGQLMVVIDPRELFEEVLPERGQLLAARWPTPSRASCGTGWRRSCGPMSSAACGSAPPQSPTGPPSGSSGTRARS